MRVRLPTRREDGHFADRDTGIVDRGPGRNVVWIGEKCDERRSATGICGNAIHRRTPATIARLTRAITRIIYDFVAAQNAMRFNCRRPSQKRAVARFGVALEAHELQWLP